MSELLTLLKWVFKPNQAFIESQEGKLSTIYRKHWEEAVQRADKAEDELVELKRRYTLIDNYHYKHGDRVCILINKLDEVSHE